MADEGLSSEEDEFFETCEEIASTSGSDSGSSDGERLAYRFKQRQWSSKPDPGAFPFFDSQFAVWRTDPASIVERRVKLFEKLGLDEFVGSATIKQPPISSCQSFPPSAASPRVFRSISDPSTGGDRLSSGYADSRSLNGNSEVSRENGGLSSSTGSSILVDSHIDADNGDDQSSSSGSGRDFACRIKDLDSGKEFIVHELGSDGLWNKLREVGTGKEISLEEFESSLGLSPIVQEMRRVDMESRTSSSNGERQRKKGWFRGIRSVMKRSSSNGVVKDNSSDRLVPDARRSPPWKMQRIKVRVCKKAAGELAELYMGQEIHAHQGPIWALKFSCGGRYLASGGQDCVVRVWKVVLLSNQIATCNDAATEDHSNSKSRKKRSSGGSKRLNDDKARLNTFGLDNEPVCCLNGHTEDILDLSWSSSKLLLLSSSMDKTVRLWDIRLQKCLQVFSHSDYVTCIKFNPADDTCFLSGSLDGKVRIWSIVEHHVIDWTDLREIVTAASYTPDGTGAMIGSSKGTCRFYNTAGNKLQLEGIIEVVSKKGKSFRGKKISGIQCMPGHPSKILVTSNDSQIRLYDGTDLIAKFKGFRNMSSQISASFSGNGGFIVSASEDSHVYLWNVTPPSSTCRGQLKMSEKSSESFFSDNVTAAVTWSVENQGKRTSDDRGTLKLGGDLFQLLKQSSFTGPCFDCLTSTVFPVTDDTSACGSQNSSSSSVGLDSAPSPKSYQGLTSPDPSSKGSAATWLEEKPITSEEEEAETPPVTDDSLELPSGGVGLVIVTASLSGEIRTFQNYVVKEGT